MTEESQAFQGNPQRVTEDTETLSSSESDSDDEVSKLQYMSLQGADTFTEPVTGTGFIYHDIMAQHKCEWDHGYPENPQRLIQPLNRCTELGLVQRCQRLPIRYATEDEITWKHTRDHVQLAQSTAQMSLEELMALSEKYDAWYANKITYEASLIAAGSTISMVEHIIQDKLSNGFAMVRPPGHHAMEQEFNGYCTFNNVALAAQFALNSGIEKILIVDWDVHHGQGTQRMFYDDPRVLYFSIHRYEHGRFWPQLRESDYDYIGKGRGEGFNINIPLNKTGMTDTDYMAAFNMVLLPVAYEFQPQLILISSGYDAAVGCPEGEMLVTPAMYAQMTHQLMGLAAGRVCVVLEGGYCLKSLAEGCALTLRSLLRDPCPKLPPFTEPSDSMMTTILNLTKILRKFWNCFRHYETLEGSEVCPFADVNEMPPEPDVTFSTPENRPEKFQIMNCYPVQEEATRVYYADLISKLISEATLSAAEYKCCYVFDAEMRSHKNIYDKSHPERPDRISKIYNSLAEWKLLQKCLTVASRLARKSELLWIHGEEYLNELLKSQSKADDELKDLPNQHKYSSIYLHQKTVHCALLSCGSLLNVVEAVMRGKAQSGVAIIRPPGHHAECNKAMGFCFINNVAVAAKFAQVHFGLTRILIVDWDVHHGNATQHQFYSDPSVLYISLHRYDNGNYFPGSSDADLDCVGSGPGKGYNVNIPWSYARMGDAEYMAAFTQIVMPISYQFAPELVLVSAGYDCAVGDPLGGYNVTPACFGHMTHMLMGLANGRVVLSLEGGYNLNSLSHSVATCTATLLGYPCPMLGTLVPNERAAETIRGVLGIQKKYWTSLKGSVAIPSVRKVDTDKWVIEKGHSNRQMRTRRSGGSKSAQDQTSRPGSAGSAGAPKKSVGISSSDSSVTASSASHSTTKKTTTTETEAKTAAETSTDTGTSTTQSSKDVEETVHSSEPSTGEAEQSTGEAEQSTGEAEQSTGEAEQSTGEAEQSTGEAEQSTGEKEAGEAKQTTKETSTETSNTADNSSVSASDRKLPNINAENSRSEEKPGVSNPRIPEIPSISDSRKPEIALPSVGAVLHPRDKSTQSAVQENASTNAVVLIPQMQNLTLTDSLPGTSREEMHECVAESESIAASHDQETASQACTQSDEGNPNESKAFKKSQPHSTPTSVIVVSDAGPASDTKSSPSTAKITTSADEIPKEQYTIKICQEYPGPPKGSGDAVGARPKVRKMPQHVFRSLVYGGEPDPEPLSIFAGNPLMASQEEALIAKERSREQGFAIPTADTTVKEAKILREGMQDNDPTRTVAGSHENRTGDASNVPSCAEHPRSSRDVGEENELLGACGGSSRPRTVQEIIGMQGVQEMHAVQPLTWCPHLTEVRPLPLSGFSPHDPCRTCGDVSENWVCLTCYAVECSRFVNEHMLMHRLETGHNMVLSYSDLSVWCYGCDHYVDNEVLIPMKNAAHEIKFGESYI